MLVSLNRLQKQLQEELTETATDESVEFYDMRISGNDVSNLNAGVLGSQLVNLQRLYSLIYSSIITRKPKLSFNVDHVTKARTSFIPAYLYSGSIGVVLALPVPEQQLIWSSHEQSAKELGDLLSMDSSDQFKEASDRLGQATLSAFVDFVQLHESNSICTDLKWKGRDARNTWVVDARRTSEILQAVSEVSDVIQQVVTVHGVLEGARTDKSSFWLRSDEGLVFSGKSDIDLSGEELAGRYQARLRQEVSINYALNQESVKFVLVGLERVH